MQGVEGHWNGQLRALGREISLHPKSLDYLYVFNTVHQHLPSLSVGFKDDAAAFVAGLGLADGAEISLIMGDGGFGQTGDMSFTQMGDLKIAGDYSAENVQLSAALSNVQWMRQIVQGAVTGSSGAAIARVASQAGLIPQIHSTSDVMTWLPNNKPLASYARSVMQRGWASATSCMMLAVTDSKLCRYFDLDRVAQGGSTKLFGGDGIPIMKYMIDSKADLYNNIAGYGATSFNFTPEGVFKELNTISMRQLSNNLPAASSIINELGQLGGRIFPRALDIGNVHQMWNEAQHQNQRLRSLYAHDVNILTDRYTGVELLDLVDLQLTMHGNGQPLTVQNGSYIVSAYTRTFSANRYFEKVTLTSQGTN